MLGIASFRLLWGLNWYARGSVAVATIGVPGESHRVPPAAPRDAWHRAARILAMGGVPGAAAAALGESGTVVDLVRRLGDLLLRGIEAPCSADLALRHEAAARPWDVAVGLENAATAGLAVRMAVDVASSALLRPHPTLPVRLAEDLVQLETGWRHWRLDLDRAEVVNACRRLGVRWKRLSYMPSAIQLGEGSRQMRLLGTVTGATSLLAARLSEDKAATSLRLAQQGIPVPRQRIVKGSEEAARAAATFGLPVVVKPRDGRWNRGVTVVWFAEDLAAAVSDADQHGHGVLVESWVPGREYRILVAGGSVCAVHERIAPVVVGDGSASVGALVERANADPAKLSPPDAWSGPIAIAAVSHSYLRWQGLALDAVPPAGLRVGVNPLPFRKYGGTYRDASDDIHPENAAMAVRIALLLGLDVAGIDIRMVDIARPWRDGPAGVCEVNVGPGLDNIAVTGRARGVDVSGRLVDIVYPAAARRPMPWVLITGFDDLEAAAAAVADRLAARFGWTVGIATAAGASVGGHRRPAPADPAPRSSLEPIAEDPAADACVAAFGLAALLAHGVGRDRFDVAAVGEAALDGRTPAHAALLRRLLAETDTAILDPEIPAARLPEAVADAVAGLAAALTR